jgi:peptide methionine sulfoxide reductase msrA/msrB
MSSVDGVVSTEVGYANGDPSISPTYEQVCRRTTGYRETVHVTYDPDRVSLDYLVYTFYSSIDPTLKDRQGNDCGPQYQSGIFWKEGDAETEATVRRISAVEARRSQPFNTVLEPLKVFVRAEEYHQKYLEKNEHGYCHIQPWTIKQASEREFDPGAYKRPSEEEIKEELTPEQYQVSQQAATEPAFDNEYDAEFRRGIFVDRVTGEPLFLSSDKFNSHCGWPSFTKPIDPNAVVYREDHKLPITRTEVRSRVGDSHLGHVFWGDRSSPNGVRYCMNSASLRFIPLEDMEKEGYGDLIPLVGPKREMW